MDWVDRIPLFLWLVAWAVTLWFAWTVGRASKEWPSEEVMSSRLIEAEFRRALLQNTKDDVATRVKDGAENRLFDGDKE